MRDCTHMGYCEPRKGIRQWFTNKSGLDILVDKSEPLVEPGAMIYLEFGRHLLDNFSISVFHLSGALSAKLHFAI